MTCSKKKKKLREKEKEGVFAWHERCRFCRFAKNAYL